MIICDWWGLLECCVVEKFVIETNYMSKYCDRSEYEQYDTVEMDGTLQIDSFYISNYVRLIKDNEVE